MRQPELDPEDLLDRLKDEYRMLQWEPLEPDQMRQATESERARTRASLEHLHRHWALPDAFDPADAGAGLRGKAMSLFGRLTFRVLSGYLRDERELLSHVVQVNEALERRCEELSRRCEQLNQDMISRQVAEASNQAKLAAWLHLDPTPMAASDRSVPGPAQGDLGLDQTEQAL